MKSVKSIQKEFRRIFDLPITEVSYSDTPHNVVNDCIYFTFSWGQADVEVKLNTKTDTYDWRVRNIDPRKWCKKEYISKVLDRLYNQPSVQWKESKTFALKQFKWVKWDERAMYFEFKVGSRDCVVNYRFTSQGYRFNEFKDPFSAILALLMGDKSLFRWVDGRSSMLK